MNASPGLLFKGCASAEWMSSRLQRFRRHWERGTDPWTVLSMELGAPEAME